MYWKFGTKVHLFIEKKNKKKYNLGNIFDIN